MPAGKKTFLCGRGSKCSSLRTSVQSRRGGGRGGENSKLGRRHVRGNVKPGSTHISQTLPISAKNKYRKRGSVLLLVCLIFFNRPSGRALFVRTGKEF